MPKGFYSLLLTGVGKGLKPPEGYESLKHLPIATVSMTLIKTVDEYLPNNLVTFGVYIFGKRRSFL